MSWYKNNKKDLENLFYLIRKRTGKNFNFIEKDYVQTLILNEISKYTDKFVFKGGTNLSRVHKVIERFSEDLDISLFFTPSETEKKSVKDFIVGIADNLGLEFDNRLSETRSKRDVNKYYFLYDSVFEENNGIKQEVLVETSTIIKDYPVEVKELGGIVYDFLKTNEGRQYTDLIIPAPILLVQSLKRSLADKVFAICDYYLDKNSERQSRHLFDIFKILPHVDYKSDSFNTVVNEVRHERYNNFLKSKGLRCKSSAPGISIPDIVNNFISDHFFENDYKEKTITLLYDNTPYDEIIKNGIKKIADWGFPRTPEKTIEIQEKITGTLISNFNTHLKHENVKKKIKTLRSKDSYEKKFLSDDGSFISSNLTDSEVYSGFIFNKANLNDLIALNNPLVSEFEWIYSDKQFLNKSINSCIKSEPEIIKIEFKNMIDSLSELKQNEVYILDDTVKDKYVFKIESLDNIRNIVNSRVQKTLLENSDDLKANNIIGKISAYKKYLLKSSKGLKM